MATPTPARFNYHDSRNKLRRMFYIARGASQDLAQTFGGSTSYAMEYHGTTPGMRTPEWIRTKSGTKQQSMTDNRAKLFIVCALLDVPWTTDYATTKTAAAAAVTALSV